MKNVWQLLIICVGLVLLTATPALADSPLSVQVSKGGTVAKVAAYSAGELADLGMSKSYYSSIDATGSPVIMAAEGITIQTLLSALGIPVGDVETIQLASSDGWSKSYSMGSYVSGSRYYFPQIVSGYDEDAEHPPEFNIDADKEKTVVNAMLAINSGEKRFGTDPAAIAMSDSDGIRFCFGQSTISDVVITGYGKYINSVTFVLIEGSSYMLPEQDIPAGETAGNQPVSPTSPHPGEEEEIEVAGLPADSLTITVGYYGGPYYTKKVFSADELASMATVKHAYTFIDAMPAVVLDSVVGVSLADVLSGAGIDVNSVETLHFYCSDVTKSWYTSMSKSYLLDTIRYYYPWLPQRWDYDNAQPMANANANSEIVTTVLAVQDNWRRFATEADFNNLTDSTRVRLVFGQTDTSTSNASRSAKWVHTIEVMLGGTAPKGISLDSSVLDLEVGSKYQLTANVEKIDNTSDTRVSWFSSDESIVKVDSSGRITVLAEGEATVTATTVVGGLTASVVINGDSEAEPEANPQEGDGDGVQQVMFDLDGANTGQNTAAVQNWRVYEMSETAIELPEIRIKEPPLHFTLMIISILFLCGIVGRLLVFRWEIRS